MGVRQLAGLLFFVIPLFGLSSSAAEPVQLDLTIELNRTEQLGEACQLLMVIGNHSPLTFSKLTAELVLFDKKGLITRRVSAPIGPVRPKKTLVVAFPIKNLRCDELARVLLNEITECEHSGEQPLDCTMAIKVEHRGATVFMK